MRAHRLAFALSRGPIPAGMLVLHDCDNPPCCNPEHLALGDQFVNMRDAARKRRLWLQVSPWKRAGARCPTARLTDAQVADIRARVAAGEKQAALARAYGVAGYTVWAVVHHRTWRYTTDEAALPHAA